MEILTVSSDSKMLSEEQVLQIHNVLIADFSDSDDPISPPGLRSEDLLSSAVGRQWTSLGQVFKYTNPVENAATLVFGLCNDHPFYNGNKRTALVAMLAHLDQNKLSLFATKQSELFNFMIRVADHTLGVRADRRARRKKPIRRTADDEVEQIAAWLAKRAGKVVRGERIITYRELRKILGAFDYQLENPRNNRIEVVRYEEKRKGLLRKTPVTERRRIGVIPWPGESRQMGIKDLKYVRQLCGLTEEDGVDSDGFYNYAVIIDGFVNRYRKVLYQLART